MWRQVTLRGDVRGTGLGAEEAPSPTSDDNLGKSMKPERRTSRRRAGAGS